MQLKLEREKIFWFLTALRRVLVRSAVVVAVLSVICFFFSRKVLLLLTSHVHVKLYYFDLSEVFFSSLEIALYMGICLSVPVILVLSWNEFKEKVRGKISRASLYIVFSIFLFYLGVVFCYLIVLPSGIGFLLSYEGGAIKATISTQKFVHFCVAMIFAFGSAFQLPIVMLFLGRLGIVTSKTFARTRRYAALVIVIVASVITPTPDIYNMSLLAVPLYILYEIGITLMKIGERGLTEKAKSV